MGFFGGADLPDLPNIDRQLNLMLDLLEQFGREAEQRRNVIDPLEQQFLSSINDLVARYAPEAAKQFDFSKELTDLYRTTALPAEQRLFRDLENFDTPERRMSESARAAGAVTTAAQAQQTAARNALRRAGVDPSDPRYAEVLGAQTPEIAARAAAAGRDAAEQVERAGLERRGIAANLGRGWQNLGQQYLQTGSTLAAAVPQAYQTGLNTAIATNGRPFDWQARQLDVANNYIDTMMQRYNAKLGRAQARASAGQGLGGALGSLAGAGLGFYMGGGFGGGLNALRGALGGARLGSDLGQGVL